MYQALVQGRIQVPVQDLSRFCFRVSLDEPTPGHTLAEGNLDSDPVSHTRTVPNAIYWSQPSVGAVHVINLWFTSRSTAREFSKTPC